MSLWPRIVSIVNNGNIGDAKLLKLSLSEALDPIQIQPVMSMEDYNQKLLLSQKPDIVFFILGNTRLSFVDDGIVSNSRPNEVIQSIWQLLDTRDDISIHVALAPAQLHSNNLNWRHLQNSYDRFTALDTLALSLSGVAGIWEINSTLLEDVRSSRPDATTLRSSWEHKRVFLYGRVAEQLYEFQHDFLSHWPCSASKNDSLSISESLVRSCLQLALGIGTLDEEKLKLGNKTKTTLQTMSHRLSEIKEHTGFFMQASTINRYLRLLDYGWEERIQGFDKKARHKMPSWIRSEGFPSSFPLIRDIPLLEVSQMLFENLENLDFDRDWDPTIARNFTSITFRSSR